MDCANKEQIPLILRFLDRNNNIREAFLAYIHIHIIWAYYINGILTFFNHLFTLVDPPLPPPSLINILQIPYSKYVNPYTKIRITPSRETKSLLLLYIIHYSKGNVAFKRKHQKLFTIVISILIMMPKLPWFSIRKLCWFSRTLFYLEWACSHEKDISEQIIHPLWMSYVKPSWLYPGLETDI